MDSPTESNIGWRCCLVAGHLPGFHHPKKSLHLRNMCSNQYSQNPKCLLRIMPNTVPGLSHLILTTALQSRDTQNFPFLKEQEGRKGSVAQEVEHLPGIHEALSPLSSTAIKKEETKSTDMEVMCRRAHSQQAESWRLRPDGLAL